VPVNPYLRIQQGSGHGVILGDSSDDAGQII